MTGGASRAAQVLLRQRTALAVNALLVLLTRTH